MQEDSDYRAAIGRNLFRIRTQKALSQRQLAKKVGVSGPYIHMIEKKGKLPNFVLAMKIANALGVMPEDLLLKEEDR